IDIAEEGTRAVGCHKSTLTGRAVTRLRVLAVVDAHLGAWYKLRVFCPGRTIRTRSDVGESMGPSTFPEVSLGSGEESPCDVEIVWRRTSQRWMFMGCGSPHSEFQHQFS